MKRVTITILIALLATACGKPFEVRDLQNEKAADKAAQTLEHKDKQSTDTIQGDPFTAEEMAGKDYVLKTDEQTFTLVGLGHLVWTRFECDAEFVNDSQEIESEKVKLNIETYPEFKVTAIGEGTAQSIADAKDLCNTPALKDGVSLNARGSLHKNKDINTYVLSYGIDSEEPVQLNIYWSADQSKMGELTCRQGNDKLVHYARISSCVLKVK